MRYIALLLSMSQRPSAISTLPQVVEESRAEAWKGVALPEIAAQDRESRNGAGQGRDWITFHIVLGFEIAAHQAMFVALFLFMGSNMFVNII